MIIAITIKEKNTDNWYRKLIDTISRNKIILENLSVNGIEILHININKKNDRIPWKKISEIANKNGNKIICDESIDLPNKYGLIRYESDGFMQRLCENTALVAIKKANINPVKINIGFYDPSGTRFNMLDFLIPLSKKIKVVSQNLNLYEKESTKALEGYDHKVVFSGDVGILNDIDVLIAPDRIEEYIPLKPNTIVFTYKVPAKKIQGIIYHDYQITKLLTLVNNTVEGLKKEYFVAALYDIGNYYELGSLVAKNCINNGKLISLDYIALSMKKNKSLI